MVWGNRKVWRVFIGGNDSIGYNYHKCGQKKCKLGKKNV